MFSLRLCNTFFFSLNHSTEQSHSKYQTDGVTKQKKWRDLDCCS